MTKIIVKSYQFNHKKKQFKECFCTSFLTAEWMSYFSFILLIKSEHNGFKATLANTNKNQ